MKILIVGSGAREHALAWKLRQSPRVTEIFFAPGNPGTAEIGTNVDISVMDTVSLIKFALENKIDLTIVGPENPLIGGIVDDFRAKGLRIFGPTKSAARIEGSKIFAKELMKNLRIPTAHFKTFSNHAEAVAYLNSTPVGWMIKADGPAAGKGAIQARTLAEGMRILDEMMVKDIFGEAGKKVVIESFLQGHEISVHAFADNLNYLLCPVVRDHKKALDGDLGENTGGMGAIGPIPVHHVHRTLIADIVARTLEGIAQAGDNFSGMLFPGLMLTNSGSAVLEFNARFGDPETEVLMRHLDSDLLDILDGCVDNRLRTVDVRWKTGAGACIMLTSGGYPEKYGKGFPIGGIQEAERVPSVKVFHAGTAVCGGRLVTAGGRVLAVTSYASGRTHYDSLKTALETAYEAVKLISFEGMHYRTDIGLSTLQSLGD